jgi:hypothetical protein
VYGASVIGVRFLVVGEAGGVFEAQFLAIDVVPDAIDFASKIVRVCGYCSEVPMEEIADHYTVSGPYWRKSIYVSAKTH